MMAFNLDYFVIDDKTSISFSGGRTSAFMLHLTLLANNGLPDCAKVIFANTGKEEEETLKFVQRCSDEWNVPITWIEYRPDGEGFEIVDFKTASRNGEPFEALIRKVNYLPNPVTRKCTFDLKVRAMSKYLRSLGWDYWDAFIGIRADEKRRVARIRANPHSDTSKATSVLPLADAGISVKDVSKFWEDSSFDLMLPTVNGKTMHGNCDLCFLKGGNQIASLIQEKPERAIWWAKMESLELASKPSGAKFRSDRPSYQQMMNYAKDQMPLFSDESIDCFCGD